MSQDRVNQSAKISTMTMSNATISLSAVEASRITVVDNSDSDEDYISTVEDNSHMTMEIFPKTIPSYESYHGDITESDRISMRTVQNAPRKAALQKLNIVNNTPEMTPLLLRVNKLQRAIAVVITGKRVSTPVQVVHLVQAKKHVVKPQIVFSLEKQLECYEVLPSFSIYRAQSQFLLTSDTQNVKVLVLPIKQKIQVGTLLRQWSTPDLLLPPEGPHQAKVLQPLWNTVTFTIALGKHVAVEYNIPQVPQRKVKQYKAEKHLLKNVDSAILYRHTPKETVVVHKATQVHQLRLSTVELQDPQLVQIVKVEQNCWDIAGAQQLKEKLYPEPNNISILPEERKNRQTHKGYKEK